MLLLLLQNSAIKLVLSGLSWFVSCVTDLVAGRLTALLFLNLLTAPLCSARDRLGDPACGGLIGGGVWTWLEHLLGRSYLLSPSFDDWAVLLAVIHTKMIYHFTI